jgi:hypothetical protein
MNTKPPLPPPFPLGSKVEYLGYQYNDGDTGKLLLRHGMIGTVTSIKQGWQGTGRVVDEVGGDGEPIYDETHNSWSIVTFETGFTRAVSSPVGTQFRKVEEK